MEPVQEGEKPCASLLLGADVSRGFVVRSGKQGAAKRGGMGAVRIRETYLRGDRLLVSMKDTLLGEGGGGEEGEGCSFQAKGGGEDSRKHGRRSSYVCPTADFLHCYLELFDRPNFAACFQREGGNGHAGAGTTNAAPPPAAGAIGGGASGQEQRPPPCSLLLLHSELSKLTGAAGALSMKQERRLSQLARSLPGTMIFFDKFCPDLHSASATATASAGATAPGVRGSREGVGGGDDSDVSPPADAPLPPTPAVHVSSASSVLEACRWCSQKLGGASVVVLSDDGKADHDGTDTGDFADHDAPPPRQPAFVVGEHARLGGASASAGGRGAGLPKVLGLREFLRGYVGGDTEEELARRGDLLRRTHLSCKASSSKGGGGPATGTATTSSPLRKPHPSKTQLEALIAGGSASKGRLDVFEHNPKEGVVAVGAGGGAALEGWADSSGRAKILVAGREGMNRSMHGDTVAVTLLPRRRWRAPTDRKRLTHAAEEEEDIPLEEFQDAEGTGGEGNAPPGAMPTGEGSVELKYWFVVGVLEEGRRPYVVTIPSEETTTEQGGTATVAAVPMDPRVPKIRIKTRQLAQISGQRLVVMVDGWDVGHVFPFGHYVTSLGPVGEVSSEAAALLVECEASFQPFSFNALASLPLVPNPPKESQKPRDALLPPATLAERERPEDGFGKAPRWQDSGWRVQEADVAGRRDLRRERAMSVDPPGCQDIDDAMHVKRKPNGKLEIGVHIADVTRFVEADSPLDREARARATTVYLVHRRIDMLPALLSSDLCSLHAGEDRLSVSVVWEAEEDGDEDIHLCKRADGSPVCWFGRTVIHSKASMTYDQAQMLVEDGRIAKKRGHEEPPPGQAGRDVREGLQPGLADDLRLLTRFARTARAERVRNGAIDLSQAGAELKFKIDPVTGTPLAVAGKEDSEIHHTIAELMILANSAVAEKIQGAFPSQALVRVHASPDPSRLTAFEGVAAKVGVSNNGESSSGKSNSSAGGLSQSLATVEGGALRGQGEGGKSKAGLLKSLAVRAMSEAEYVSTGTLSDHQANGKGLEAQEESRFGHFGLGLSHYTHFTSPIRRYADIVVHRLLLASLGVSFTQAPNATHHTAKPSPRLLSGGGLDAPPSAKREDDEGVVALPSSLAPSVMEMEEAAVGKVETDAAAERRSRRAGAGDASLVTNPDGTRTYSKAREYLTPAPGAPGSPIFVSVATTPTAPTPAMTASRLPPPPGMESFPELAGPEDGDDLLDSLLGLEVSGSTAAIAAADSNSGFGGSEDVGEGTTKAKSFSAATAASGTAAAAAAAAAASATFDGDGDSMLDALLGLEIGPTMARNGVKATPGEEEEEEEEEGRDDDITAHGGGGGGTGGESSPSAGGSVVVASSPPPFGGAELGRLCTHLNDRNRRAKRLAQRCQEMFLRLFFKDHSQVVQGLVLSLRSNGFIAYVPAFDAKGPVYISDRDGHVQVDPALLGLPARAGNPPSKAFATLPACRALPGAGVTLVSSPPPAGKRTAISAYNKDKAGRGGGQGRDGEGKEDEEVLEVRPPPGGGGKVLRLRVLDGVSLRLSCEVLPTQARLPKVRFLLAGVGNHPASPSPAAAAPAGTSATATRARATRPEHQVHPSRPVPGGDVRIDPSGMRLGGGQGLGGAGGGGGDGAALLLSKESGGSSDGRPREGGGSGGGGGGLYWLLQGARDDAVVRGNFDEPGGGPAGEASTTSTGATEPSPPASTAAAAEVAARRKEKKERNKRKSSNSGGSTASSACPNREQQQRSEVGAGRALFGGFVPRRHAPAASLYDFGGKGGGAGSELGGGETGGDGGGFAGVSSLPSIYSQGGGRGVVPAGGGVLETLDDARVRQYTQEATARAQRLGAEKRSSRITKSKRQG
ncbi:unnamed protein product [Ectocarpus fasciculatus]